MSESAPATSTPVVEPSAHVALEVRNAYRAFGATQALAGASLRVQRATVHALLGANGSGKSTLIRALAGYHALDSGDMLVHGEALDADDRAGEGKRAALRFVHQDLALIPSLSVADNLALDRGYVRDRLGGIAWRSEYARVQRDLEGVGLASLDPRVPVADLGPVDRTLVAIARALDEIDPARNLLILDEPTARLPQEEAAKLLSTVRSLRDRGLPVIYITHRLEELENFADDVTVFRDGRVVFAGAWSGTSIRGLRALIAGLDEDVVGTRPTVAAASRSDAGVPVLGLRNVTSSRLRGVTLTVHRGELVAVTGLVGGGRSELGRVAYGIQSFADGEIEISGKIHRAGSTRAVHDQRVGYLPQERVNSLLAGLTVEENITIASFDHLGSWYGLVRDRVREAARRVVEMLDVRPSDPARVVNTLSGGNQQKVALGRWLRLPLDLLILDEPTQSIDVAAKEDLMTAIKLRAAETGLAVLWLESDVEELVKYADRVLVLNDGRICTEFARPPFSVGEVLAQTYASEQEEA